MIEEHVRLDLDVTTTAYAPGQTLERKGTISINIIDDISLENVQRVLDRAIGDAKQFDAQLKSAQPKVHKKARRKSTAKT